MGRCSWLHSRNLILNSEIQNLIKIHSIVNCVPRFESDVILVILVCIYWNIYHSRLWLYDPHSFTCNDKITKSFLMVIFGYTLMKLFQCQMFFFNVMNGGVRNDKWNHMVYSKVLCIRMSGDFVVRIGFNFVECVSHKSHASSVIHFFFWVRCFRFRCNKSELTSWI